MVAQPVRVNAEKNVVLAFPTPVWLVDFDGMAELNSALDAEILAMEETARKSSENYSDNYPSGYTTYFDRPTLFADPPFDQLADVVFRAATEYAAERGYDMTRCRLAMTSMWGNVQYKNGIHALHHHPNSNMSGVYYVSVPDDSGKLRIRDPNILARMAEPPFDQHTLTSANSMEFSPKEGRLIIFPSYLEHEVMPHGSELPRVSVSYNIRVERGVEKRAV